MKNFSSNNAPYDFTCNKSYCSNLVYENDYYVGLVLELDPMTMIRMCVPCGRHEWLHNRKINGKDVYELSCPQCGQADSFFRTAKVTILCEQRSAVIDDDSGIDFENHTGCPECDHWGDVEEFMNGDADRLFDEPVDPYMVISG